MSFAPDLHVFPGGRVDPGDADPRLAARSARSAAEAGAALGGNVPEPDALALHHAAIRELWEEAGVLLVDELMPDAGVAIDAGRAGLLDGSRTLGDALGGGSLRIRTDALVPLAHWTTPAFMPRRFSTWFFAADLPDGAVPSFDGREVVDHVWLTPHTALERVAEGAMDMWVPTTSILQGLIAIEAMSAADVAREVRLGRVAPPRVATVAGDETRIESWSAGGVPGRKAVTTVIGSRQLVVVDPGDPSDEALRAIDGVVRERGGAARIEAVVLTAGVPDRAGGAEALAIPLGIPILVAPGAGRHLPYAVRELADGERLPSDVGRAVRLGPHGSGTLEIVAP